ncbi:MAG: MBOAT family protein [Deltaproteobacteria bacterium]|nr:MBOAT family protein [Deltaproteobacteria bacterium]
MIFGGAAFVFFFPLVLALHWLVPRRASDQNAVLLLASYAFVWCWNPRLLWVFVLSTAVNYLAGLALDRPAGASPSRRARLALGLGVGWDLAQLALFKYLGFFAVSLNELLGALGAAARLPVVHVAALVGVSFWTLTQIGYLIDVYYGRIRACRSPLQFATFIAFFPQLMAGPIVRGRDLLPQYREARSLGLDALRGGCGLFFLGFFMKFYVADYLGHWIVDPVFTHPEKWNAASHWLALAGFAVQVFDDFAGYSFMALGLGRLLGIELPLNFDHPFLSRGLMELWRRWHITLNTWLFDYLYYPLTTSQGSFRGRLDLGFAVVFAVSGLWHGATWMFVTWGALQGLGLMVQRRWDVFYKSLCRRDRTWVARRKSEAYGAAAWLITIGFFVVSLVPFRSPTAGAALEFVRGLAGHQGSRFVVQGGAATWFNLLVCFGFVALHHVLGSARLRPWADRLFGLPALLRGFAYGLVIVFLLVFMPLGAGSFIYANF